MNVPSGVRSVIYTLAPLAWVSGLVLSIDPLLTTCVVGLSTGVLILAWQNASAHTALVTPISTNESSSLPGGWEADSYTEKMAVAGAEWTNYPSDPMTEPREPQGCHNDAPATEWQPPVPGCEKPLINDTIYGRTVNGKLSNDEHVLSNDDIITMSPSGYIPTSRRMGTKHTHEYTIEEQTMSDKYPTRICRCGRVAPHPSEYDRYIS